MEKGTEGVVREDERRSERPNETEETRKTEEVG